MKDKTYNCSDCNKEIRNKSVTPELASLKLCPQCYTIRQTKKCPECKGLKTFPGTYKGGNTNSWTLCLKCKGTGKVEK